jgi:hypothetical protein
MQCLKPLHKTHRLAAYGSLFPIKTSEYTSNLFHYARRGRISLCVSQSLSNEPWSVFLSLVESNFQITPIVRNKRRCGFTKYLKKIYERYHTERIQASTDSMRAIN